MDQYLGELDVQVQAAPFRKAVAYSFFAISFRNAGSSFRGSLSGTSFIVFWALLITLRDLKVHTNGMALAFDASAKQGCPILRGLTGKIHYSM